MVQNTFQTILLFLCLCCVSRTDHNLTCDSSSKQGIYFDRSSNSTIGRYIIKWCVERNSTANKWEVTLEYRMSETNMKCNKKNLRRFKIHSIFTEYVQSNCTNICLEKELDAIFNATCYKIHTALCQQEQEQEIQISSNTSYHYITDSKPQEEFINRTRVTVQPDGNDTIIDWYLGVPVSDCELKFHIKEKEVQVPYSCRAEDLQRLRVRCRARLEPACYQVTFRHYKPWVAIDNKIKGPFIWSFCRNESTNYELLRAERSEQWWALGCALALLLLAALLLAAHSLWLRRDARASRLHRHEKPSPPAAAAASAAPAGRVLLLYARDSAHVSRAAELLAALLRLRAAHEVIDLYNPETVSAAAPAEGEWLRALLTSAETRVLLLLTPATSLYCSRLATSDTGSPTLQAPLLSQQVMWQCPHAADPLLQLALRLLTETAHTEPLPYKKYYVASIAGVQHNEVVPTVTPQRRYLLPHAADHLLDHIANPSLVSPPDLLLGAPDFTLVPSESPSSSPHDSPSSPPDSPSSPSHSSSSPPDSPSLPLTPPYLPSTPPSDPECSLLQQLCATLEEFRRYTVDNPNYLFANLVCE